MTEVGWIPKDWEVKTLGEVCNVKGRIGFRGYTKKDLVDKGFGAITLSPSNINDNHELDTKDATYISWFKYEESPEIKVYNNDILFVKTGSTYGKSALVKGLKEKATINPQFALLKDISCEPPFLASVITQPIIQKQVELSVVGGAIPTMSQQKISEFVFPFPPTSEQRRIAQVLSDTDSLIASLSRTIEKKRLVKQGAMQQLLTGKTRLKGFSGEWVEKELGEIGQLTGAGVDKTIKEEETPVRLLNFLDVYNRDRIYSRELKMWVTASEMKIQKCDIRCGDIFLTPSSELPNDIGRSAVAMQDIQDACYSYHILRLRPYDKLDLNYSAYMLKTADFEQQIRFLSEGSGKRYVISLKNFREIRIRIPSDIREQEAIGLRIATMDNEISSLEAELQKYKALKQGMMQKLLTGQIRLK